MGLMTVESTNKSLVVREANMPRRSEQAVACPSSTKIGRHSFDGLPVTPETVTALAAMLVGLLREQLSEDALILSMYAARDMAEEMGVSDEEFDRVKTIVLTKWIEMKRRHPLGSMF